MKVIFKWKRVQFFWLTAVVRIQCQPLLYNQFIVVFSYRNKYLYKIYYNTRLVNRKRTRARLIQFSSDSSGLLELERIKVVITDW